MVKYAILCRNSRSDYWVLERCAITLIEAYFWKFVYKFYYKYVEIKSLYGEKEITPTEKEKWRWNYGTAF